MTRLTTFLLAIAITPALALAQNGPTAKNNKKQKEATAATNPTTEPTGSATSSPAPIAKNMRDYAKTPQGKSRQQKLSKNFDASLEKDIKYPAGSSLKVNMVKNPS